MRSKWRCLAIMDIIMFGKAYHHKLLMPAVKHSGGGLMIQVCFAAKGLGHFAVTESNMNSSVYQSILESKVRPSY